MGLARRAGALGMTVVVADINAAKLCAERHLGRRRIHGIEVVGLRAACSAHIASRVGLAHAVVVQTRAECEAGADACCPFTVVNLVLPSGAVLDAIEVDCGDAGEAICPVVTAVCCKGQTWRVGCSV